MDLASAAAVTPDVLVQGAAPSDTSKGLLEKVPLPTTQGQTTALWTERSPHGNYVKFSDVLGKGAFKTVYKGQDVNNGNLVAWNEVNIKSYGQKEKKRIMNEIMLLRTLLHPNLISFYGGWVNKEAEKVVFVTELMSSGTLKEFSAKYPIPLKQIKRYCREILECIHYLHTPGAVEGAAAPAASTTGGTGEADVSVTRRAAKPVVIHRDLKCDNIFIMNQGKGIKIGDLGLATTDGRSVMGTPEFMAPEMYETGYSTSVDVYAFGLCLLEMVTGRTPYVECGTVVAIYKSVLAGLLPENIRILESGWPEAFHFILRCLAPQSEAAAGAATIVDGESGAGEDTDDETDVESGAGAPTTVAASQMSNGVAANSGAMENDGHAPEAMSDADVEVHAVKVTKPRRSHLRPTAWDLLHDAFLTVTDEDASRTTWDVRKAAEAKGMFIITGPDDPHRRPEATQKMPIASLPDSARIATMGGIVDERANKVEAAEVPIDSLVAPAAVSSAGTDAYVSAQIGSDSDRASSTTQSTLAGRAPRTDPFRSATKTHGNATHAEPNLQTLSDEVKTLRHWVAQTYGLVEWLVLQQENGRRFLEARAGRKVSQRIGSERDPAMDATSLGDIRTSRRSKAKTVSFANAASETRPEVMKSSDASATTFLSSELASSQIGLEVCKHQTAASVDGISIESILLETDLALSDSIQQPYTDDSESFDAIQGAINKLKFEEKREEYRAGKIAAKQLQDLHDSNKRVESEHNESLETERERHRIEVERSDKLRSEVLQVLLPLRGRRERADANSDADCVAEEDVLTLRDRTEEQLFSRRLELLTGREMDEIQKHNEAISSIDESFDRQHKLFAAKEKTLRENFVTKIEKLRSDLQAQYVKMRDSQRFSQFASGDAVEAYSSDMEKKLDRSSPLKDESALLSQSPQLIFFSESSLGEKKSEIASTSPRDSLVKTTQAPGLQGLSSQTQGNNEG